MNWVQQPTSHTLHYAGFAAGIDKQTYQWMVSEVSFGEDDIATLTPRWWGTATSLEQAKACVEALVQ